MATRLRAQTGAREVRVESAPDVRAQGALTTEEASGKAGKLGRLGRLRGAGCTGSGHSSRPKGTRPWRPGTYGSGERCETFRFFPKLSETFRFVPEFSVPFRCVPLRSGRFRGSAGVARSRRDRAPGSAAGGPKWQFLWRPRSYGLGERCETFRFFPKLSGSFRFFPFLSGVFRSFPFLSALFRAAPGAADGSGIRPEAWRMRRETIECPAYAFGI